MTLLVGFWGLLFIKSIQDNPRSYLKIGLNIGLGIISFVPALMYYQLIGFHPINPTNYEREIFEIVKTLPKKIILAGSPDDLDGIPLFAQRNVLFRHLFPDSNAPIVEMFDAYYGEDPDRILDFCYQYGVDYWLRDVRDFELDYLNAGDFFSCHTTHKSRKRFQEDQILF